MPSEPSDTFNATAHRVVRPSGHRGGTLRFVRTDDFDTLDPGDTYYGYTWNFLRLYGRSLVGHRYRPGRPPELLPDLARELGTASDGGRVWTYRLREGLRFEDGTPVTAADVRYAIRRSNFPETVFGPGVLGGGPSYFRQYLDGGIDGVEAPDDHTLVFRLAAPFGGFDFLAGLPSTVPVPQKRDAGAGYATCPVATGPYRVADYARGDRLTLERNPHWASDTDPVRTGLPERVTVRLGVDGHEVDRMLLAGEADVDLAGVGVQPATQERLLSEPALRQHTDHPHTGFVWLYCLTPSVPPLDRLPARRAVQYATDKAAMRAAYGGEPVGDLATSLLPPGMPGQRPHDPYPVGRDGHGDLARARAELAAAGLPDGFRTRIAARADRIKEFEAARALAAGLARVGIDAEVVPFPSGEYFSRRAGVPRYVREQGLGILMFGWGADFPDGFGFLQQITDGRAIKASGNQNLGELDDPGVNALLDRGAQALDPATRARIWGEVDERVMAAATHCPYLSVRSVSYRGPRTTNVTPGPHGMYDYARLGVSDAR